jgi:hypothetical protein
VTGASGSPSMRESHGERKAVLVSGKAIWLGMGTTKYVAGLGCLWRLLCAIARRTSGVPTIPEQARVHRIHRRTFCRAICGLLRKGGTAEVAVGAAMIRDSL